MIILAALILLTGGCSEQDASQPDAAQPDASQPDAAQPDALQPDAAQADASQPDAAHGSAQGGEGQPCREDGSCDQGLKCSAEDLCVAAAPTCVPTCDPSAETCVDGHCLPKSTIKVCAQTCQADEDCALWTGSLAYRCHPTSKRCVECLTAQDCAFQASVWTYPCTVGDDECVDAYEACIDIGGGAGRCAELATAGGDCAFARSVAEQWPALDGSGDVSVCIDRSASCSANDLCVIATVTPDCTQGSCEAFGGVGRPDCDPVSKRCMCNATSCQATGYSKCLPDGTCGCSKNDECEASAASPTCYPDGRCGCSDAATCTATSRFEKSGADCVDALFHYPW